MLKPALKLDLTSFKIRKHKNMWIEKASCVYLTSGTKAKVRVISRSKEYVGECIKKSPVGSVHRKHRSELLIHLQYLGGTQSHQRRGWYWHYEKGKVWKVTSGGLNRRVLWGYYLNIRIKAVETSQTQSPPDWLSHLLGEEPASLVWASHWRTRSPKPRRICLFRSHAGITSQSVNRITFKCNICISWLISAHAVNMHAELYSSSTNRRVASQKWASKSWNLLSSKHFSPMAFPTIIWILKLVPRAKKRGNHGIDDSKCLGAVRRSSSETELNLGTLEQSDST